MYLIVMFVPLLPFLRCWLEYVTEKNGSSYFIFHLIGLLAKFCFVGTPQHSHKRCTFEPSEGGAVSSTSRANKNMQPQPQP